MDINRQWQSILIVSIGGNKVIALPPVAESAEGIMMIMKKYKTLSDRSIVMAVVVTVTSLSSSAKCCAGYWMSIPLLRSWGAVGTGR